LRTVEFSFEGLQGKILSSESGELAFDGGSPPSVPEPAYVLLHGIGVSHRYLARLHGELALSTPTYSIDLPGFGGNPKPRRQLSVEEYAAFVAAALESQGVDSYVLVGHSMGVQFAIEAALQHPERVRQIVLMGPVVDARHRSVFRQTVALARDGLFFESPSSNWLVFTDYLRCGLPWYLTELPVMIEYRTEERLRDVKVPVLVLRGSQDPVAGPEWALNLSRIAYQGRLVEIPHCGHVAQHLRPQAVADAIRTFVAATAQPRDPRR
jgi:pimeloyl-ACP methyl ester carboxylesterase